MNLRLKKLDLLILRSFMGPFIVTFFLVLFAFTLQFYWLYMDELIGKGLGIGLTMRLMLYMAATLVPIALPLGILLAAIMTFGGLGENFELVAIKSSGISLFRFMRPLIIFITAISILAFFFNNYVIPVASLKSYSLLYDMRNQKPTMNIKEGIFNKEIDNFAIRVGKKGKDGQSISDIIIYDHTNGAKNNNVVIAEKGKMYPAEDGKFLVFELHNGWRYEEGQDEEEGEPIQTRMHFSKWYKIFDLSKFAFSRTKEDLFKGNEEMMTVQQLSERISDMNKKQKEATNDIERYIKPYFYVLDESNKPLDSLTKNSKFAFTYQKSIVEHIPDSLRSKVANSVQSNLKSMDRMVKISSSDLTINTLKIKKSLILWHKKFTLSFSCILLFLIGAPLGAIIRKGGLGMPVIIAVGFFIIYFIISSTGEKLAQQGIVSPWYGMWLATGILLPIASTIMISARNDSAIFNREWYGKIGYQVKKLFKKNTRHVS